MATAASAAVPIIAIANRGLSSAPATLQCPGQPQGTHLYTWPGRGQIAQCPHCTPCPRAWGCLCLHSCAIPESSRYSRTKSCWGKVTIPSSQTFEICGEMNVTSASTKTRPSSMTDQNDSDRGEGVVFPGGKKNLLQSLCRLLQTVSGTQWKLWCMQEGKKTWPLVKREKSKYYYI